MSKGQKLLGKFIALRKEVSMHLFPEKSIIIQEKYGDRSKMDYVNCSAARILLLCNGKKTLSQIIEQTCKEQRVDFHQYTKPLEHFIVESYKRGYIEYSDVPVKREIKAAGNSDYATPLHAVIELTYRCNLNCKHCYVDLTGKYASDLGGTSALHVLQKLVSNGVRSVELTGGEPLMHPDFGRIFEFCVNNFSQVGLLTNGTLVNEDRAKAWSNYSSKFLVSISLDSAKPDFHDSFRGLKGAFDRTTRAISLLSNFGINVRVSMTITPENIYDIENTILLAKSLGAKWFSYSFVMPVG